MSKMYTLVRKDLPWSIRTVQACHSVAEFILNEKTEWDNGTMVVLGVKNEKELLKWISELCGVGHPYQAFIEPDLGNQTTAVTFVGVPEPLQEDICFLPLL